MQKLHDICTVEGCSFKHHARGLCGTHYQMLKRGITDFKPIKTRVSVKPECCEVDGCDLPVKSKGLCATHYQRLLRHGHVRNIDRAKPFQQCSESGCKNHAYAKSLCNAHYIKQSRALKVFGLTREKHLDMLNEQNHVCKICGKPEQSKDPKSGKTKSLAIDHNHNTGIVRGLLCSNCNRGIGLFGDSIETLKSAIQYLESNK